MPPSVIQRLQVPIGAGYVLKLYDTLARPDGHYQLRYSFRRSGNNRKPPIFAGSLLLPPAADPTERTFALSLLYRLAAHPGEVPAHQFTTYTQPQLEFAATDAPAVRRWAELAALTKSQRLYLRQFRGVR